MMHRDGVRALHSSKRTWLLGTALGAWLATVPGCVVGQRPGNGQVRYLREPTMGATYWLYLPEGYEERAANGFRPRYPLVVTFHGMKPFDDDHRQIREWQQEADRYGFVVCAPSLRVSALSSPLPLRNSKNARLKRDEEATLAILDDVNRIADVDPNKVLATSWSYGGYVAHYMVNHHPERFRCLAVKQSNFNADILDPDNVPRYRDRKIGIFYTENDFAICRRESHEGAEWYARHGFDLTFAVFEKKGHERTPGVAAEFFARVVGAEPKTPPVELARMQVIPQPTARRTESPPAAHLVPPTDDQAGDKASTVTTAEDRSELRSTPTPPSDFRTKFIAPAPASTRPVRVVVDPPRGESPLLVRYSTVMPQSMQRGATALWMDNGEPISNGLHGQRVFHEVGAHTLEVLVSTRSGRDYRASSTITVTPKAGSRE